MNKKWILSLAVFVLLLIGCKSNEERANELIRTELYKTLYDWDSYQPIETKVEKAMSSVYTDSACWKQLDVYRASYEVTKSYVEKAIDAKNNMDYWGKPTRYSTSFSDSRYYNYREEYLDAMEFSVTLDKLSKTFKIDLDSMVAELDTSKQIGWEVVHNFRYKTQEGTPEIGHYRYVMDMDFSRIIIKEDLDSKDSKVLRKVYESR